MHAGQRSWPCIPAVAAPGPTSLSRQEWRAGEGPAQIRLWHRTLDHGGRGPWYTHVAPPDWDKGTCRPVKAVTAGSTPITSACANVTAAGRAAAGRVVYSAAHTCSSRCEAAQPAEAHGD